VFAKHLPPSAERPRVLALDGAAAAELAGQSLVTAARDLLDYPPGAFDAIAGPAAPEQIATLCQALRPGGRLILTDRADPETLLAALTAAGLIHCLVEPHGPLVLYRGERPPEGSSLERTRTLAANRPAGAAPALPITSPEALTGPYVFLLIRQTPNKPAWKLAPGEPVTWQAATVLAAGEPVLLAFSSLVKAVACLQGAVLAGQLGGINKVGKFPKSAARAWALPLTLNPTFEAIRHLEPGPPIEVDPLTAITGDE